LKDQIDNFYKDHKKKKYYNGLLSTIIKGLNLKEMQKRNLFQMMNFNYSELHNVLFKYQKNPNTEDIREEIEILSQKWINEMDFDKVK